MVNHDSVWRLQRGQLAKVEVTMTEKAQICGECGARQFTAFTNGPAVINLFKLRDKHPALPKTLASLFA